MRLAIYRSCLHSSLCTEAVLAAIQAFFSPASADMAGAPAGVGSVVATAEKRSENGQNIPATVRVLSVAEIKTREVKTVGDVAQMVPTINFVLPRGMGMNLIAGDSESSVMVQLDGIPLKRPNTLERARAYFIDSFYGQIHALDAQPYQITIGLNRRKFISLAI